MKEFMAIVEAGNTASFPQWFSDAPPAAMDDTDVPDATYILEPDEFDLDWRRCEVPASAFREIVGPDFFTWFARICPTETREREAERVAEIEKWMGSDPHAALASHPLIVLINPMNGKFEVLDGHHRAAVAIHKMGIQAIPCVVAIG